MDKTLFFFDGECGFCRSVARHYKKADGHEKVLFVDVNDKEKFTRYSQGLDQEEAKKVIHARLPSGEVKTGVDALITLWQTFPNYHILAKVFDHKATKPIAQVFYRFIAKHRKQIPSFLLKD